MDILLPTLAGTSTVIATGAVLYRVLRPRFSVTVNCWFCGQDTKVPHGNQNCWDCPSCDQYNGFTQDGDYNKPIPSQYSEDLNHPITAENKPHHQSAAPTNALCELCNRNQILKIRQLADFVPENEVLYDLEVERYKVYLESVYGLCRQCELNVNETLDKQDNILEKKLQRHLGRTIQQADISASDSVCSEHIYCRLSTPWHATLLRIMALVCVVSLVVTSSFMLLEDSQIHAKPRQFLPVVIADYLQEIYSSAVTVVVTGLLGNLTAVYLSGKQAVQGSDAIAVFLWLALLVLHSSPVVHTLDHSDVYLLQSVAALMCTLLSLWCSLISRYNKAPSTRITKKRYNNLDTSHVTSTSGSLDNSPAPSVANDHQVQEPVIAEGQQPHLDRLETMSIGSVRAQGRDGSSKIPKAFNQFPAAGQLNASPPGRPHHMPFPHLGGTPRPILQPARFQPSNPWAAVAAQRGPSPFSSSSTTQRAASGSSTGPTWTTLSSLPKFTSQLSGPAFVNQGASFAEDRASLFSEPRAPTADNSSRSSSAPSTHSSRSNSQECPVDTTTQELHQQNTEVCKKRSIFSQCLWGISIGLNITILAYFTLDFTYWRAHLDKAVEYFTR